MFGFPIKFVLHFIGWPLGWVVLTLIWAYREKQKEKKEDVWIAENILGKGSEN